jgi:hypothetical protein
MKSILMTSAKKLPGWHKGLPDVNDDYEYPLDFKQGAGQLDGLAAYRLLTSGSARDGDVNTAGWDVGVIEPNYVIEKVYRFKTASAGRLTATLVWNRAYENRYPFGLRINLWSDLLLQLWAVDARGRYELADYSDSPVDNVEHLYTNLKSDMVYELVVSHSFNTALPSGFTPYAFSWQIAR